MDSVSIESYLKIVLNEFEYKENGYFILRSGLYEINYLAFRVYRDSVVFYYDYNYKKATVSISFIVKDFIDVIFPLLVESKIYELEDIITSADYRIE